MKGYLTLTRKEMAILSQMALSLRSGRGVLEQDLSGWMAAGLELDDEYFQAITIRTGSEDVKFLVERMEAKVAELEGECNDARDALLALKAAASQFEPELNVEGTQ